MKPATAHTRSSSRSPHLRHHAAAGFNDPAAVLYLCPLRHWRIFEEVERVPITVVEVEPFPAKERRYGTMWNVRSSLASLPVTRRPGMSWPAVGGVRKVRWSRSGTGKRGGVRAIYYFHDESMPLFLLTVYPKNQQDNLSAAELRARKQTVSTLRSTYGKNN
jgi:hypothetical protein